MKAKLFAVLLSCLLFSIGASASPAVESIVPKNHPAISAPVSPAINLNTVDVKTLSKSFKGIGIKRAESIIKYREAHNGFKAVTDLSDVPLIGKNFVSKHLAELEQVFTVK